jgi:hypothetical protein
MIFSKALSVLKSSVALIIFASGFAAGTAQAEWQDASVDKLRIVVDASYPSSEKLFKGVRENPSSGAHSDSLGLGRSQQSGKHFWYSWQTLPRGFTDAGFGLVDGAKATIDIFKGADFSREGREEHKIASIGVDVTVLIANVTFANGDVRRCGVWQETFGGNANILKGYFCSAKNKPDLDVSEISALFKAVSKK